MERLSTMNRIYDFVGSKVRPIELAMFLKFLLGAKRKFYPIRNFELFLDPVSNFGMRLIKHGYYEPDTTKQIVEILEEGDTFIDLGGNEGYFSLIASRRVGKIGHVYCIEPQSRLFDIILNNANRNKCYNITLLPFAASDKIEEIEITLSPTLNTGSSTIVSNSRKALWKKQKLLTTTLDDLFYYQGRKPIKLLKVDIEGFEFFAMKGAKKLLENRLFEYISIEMHPVQLKQLGQSEEMILDFLKEYGYEGSNGLFTHKETVMAERIVG